jgi:hypothetical protein
MHATTLKALMGCCQVYRSETRHRPLLTSALLRRNRSAARTAGAAVLLTLLLPAPALAHVSVRPTLLLAGTDTLLRIELPALRPGRNPIALDLSGPGVSQRSSASAGRLGDESRWRVRVRVDAEAGPVAVVLRARYADGQTVAVPQTLTVLPAEASSDSGTPAVLVAGLVAGLLAVGVGALALLNFKKKSRSAW